MELVVGAGSNVDTGCSDTSVRRVRGDDREHRQAVKALALCGGLFFLNCIVRQLAGFDHVFKTYIQ